MVNSEELNLIFHSFADPTRRAILEKVARGNPSVGELAAPFAMSAPAISKHLKVLEKAGLITRIKEGQVSRFRLNRGPIELGLDWARVLEAGASSGFDVAEQPAALEELEDYLL